MKTTLLWITLLVLCMFAVAQEPQPSPEVSGDAEIRVGLAEVQAALASARAELKALLVDDGKRQNGRLKTSLDTTEKKLNAAQVRTARLVEAQKRTEKLVAEQVLLTNTVIQERDRVIQERDALQLKIKKNNGTVKCQIFRLGCIDQK